MDRSSSTSAATHWCSDYVRSLIERRRAETTAYLIGNSVLGLLTHPDQLAKLRRDPTLMPGAANHDPQRFRDPERVNITRRPDSRGVQHLAYSYGSHYCLGATLANQELELALGTLFGRFPDLSAAVPAERLAWRPVPGTRQLVALPVRLGEPAADAG